MKELTREEALELHRQMWTDMQEKLGDCPNWGERCDFKENWCLEHTPDYIPENDCYLCEYTSQIGDSCDSCPIDWGEGGNCIHSRVTYHSSRISDILALPERSTNEQ